MLNRELPKPIKRAMRSLCGLAHEAELRQALHELSQEFDRWKASRIDSFELADRIASVNLIWPLSIVSFGPTLLVNLS
jgi:hypothetical protein